jgi:hypothetical protein
MRLFWTRRYYECADCRQHLFIPIETQPQEPHSLHPPEAHAG